MSDELRPRAANGRIILIGYRGTGKTTVGRLLAAKLGWAFADCDELVEARAGMSIKDVFATAGEPAFRDLEASALAESCARDRCVVSTGGGAVLRPANRALLKGSGFVVWLTAAVEVLAERLAGDPATGARRPNLTAAGGAAEIRHMLAAREPLYQELADVRVPTDEWSPDAVADAILISWNSCHSSRPCSGACGSSPSA